MLLPTINKPRLASSTGGVSCQGVERIFPVHSKVIDKVDLLRSSKVRRAKLYYLRGLKGKAARLRDVEKPS